MIAKDLARRAMRRSSVSPVHGGGWVGHFRVVTDYHGFADPVRGWLGASERGSPRGILWGFTVLLCHGSRGRGFRPRPEPFGGVEPLGLGLGEDIPRIWGQRRADADRWRTLPEAPALGSMPSVGYLVEASGHVLELQTMELAF